MEGEVEERYPGLHERRSTFDYGHASWASHIISSSHHAYSAGLARLVRLFG